MIHVSLKLMGVLKSKTPEDGGISLQDGAVILDLLEQLEIPADSVHVFTINGSLVRDKQYALQDGDDVTVLPPVGGG